MKTEHLNAERQCKLAELRTKSIDEGRRGKGEPGGIVGKFAPKSDLS